MDHQYIGARYVPRFMGTYDNTQQYEALEVVDNGSGTSYISKIPTPPGTPLTDTTHWAIYGASSGAIINLQNQIDDINADIGDIDDLKTNDKSSVVNAINSMKKKYIFIGDSYAHMGSNGWVDQIVSIMGLSSDDYYANYLGGIGFASATSFLDMLMGLDSGIPNHDLITDIVVLGGINDYYQTEADIVAGVNNFLTYAKTNYKNAVVTIGMISGNSNPAHLGPEFQKLIKCYSNSKGGKYLNNVEFVLHNYSLMGSDMIHPTTAGMQILSQKIVEALNGGCSVHYYDTSVLTNYITNWDPDHNDYACGVSINNNVLSIQLPSKIGISTTDSGSYLSITSGTGVKLFDIQSDLFLGLNAFDDQRQFMKIPCYAIVRGRSTPKYYTINGHLEILNKHVYLVSYDRQIAENTADFSAIDIMSIYPQGTPSAYTDLV